MFGQGFLDFVNNIKRNVKKKPNKRSNKRWIGHDFKYRYNKF